MQEQIDREKENLRNWVESGGPKKWVSSHAGRSVDYDIEALLDELRESSFWPMQEDEIRRQVTGEAWRHLRAADRRLDQSKRNRLNQPAWQYAFGLAAIGLACGFYAGASSTPIVGTLLPLMFALIGGTSGIFLATADLEAGLVDWRLRWVGRVTGIFGLACLLGSAPGILLRLHFSHPLPSETLPTLWHGSSRDAIQLAALRTKLGLLGLDVTEQNFVLNLASEELKAMAQPLPAERLKKLIALSEIVAKTIDDGINSSKSNKIDTPEDIDLLYICITNFQHHASYWVTNGMPKDLFAIDLDSLFFHLSQLAIQGKTEDLRWIGQVKLDRSAIDAMFALVHEEFRNRDILDWRMGDTTGEQIDKLLQWLKKSNLKTISSDDLMPAEDPDAASKKRRNARQKCRALSIRPTELTIELQIH